MFEGSYVAIVTPFKDNKVDFECLKKLIEFHIKNGINGLIAPVGSSYILSGEILKFLKDSNLRLKLKEGAENTKLPYNSFEDYRDKLVDSWLTCKK